MVTIRAVNLTDDIISCTLGWTSPYWIHMAGWGPLHLYGHVGPSAVWLTTSWQVIFIQTRCYWYILLSYLLLMLIIIAIIVLLQIISISQYLLWFDTLNFRFREWIFLIIGPHKSLITMWLYKGSWNFKCFNTIL